MIWNHFRNLDTPLKKIIWEYLLFEKHFHHFQICYPIYRVATLFWPRVQIQESWWWREGERFLNVLILVVSKKRYCRQVLKLHYMIWAIGYIRPQKTFGNIFYLKINFIISRFVIPFTVRQPWLGQESKSKKKAGDDEKVNGFCFWWYRKKLPQKQNMEPKKSFRNIFYLKINFSIFRVFLLYRVSAMVWPGFEMQKLVMPIMCGGWSNNLRWLSVFIFTVQMIPPSKTNHLGISSIWKSISANSNVLSPLLGFISTLFWPGAQIRESWWRQEGERVLIHSGFT